MPMSRSIETRYPRSREPSLLARVGIPSLSVFEVVLGFLEPLNIPTRGTQALLV